MSVFGWLADRIVPPAAVRVSAADAALRLHAEQMHHDGLSHHTDDCGLIRRHYADVVADNQRLRAANVALAAEVDAAEKRAESAEAELAWVDDQLRRRGLDAA